MPVSEDTGSVETQGSSKAREQDGLEKSMEEVVICRTATSEFLEVQLQLYTIPVPAVIDTAAEVTLVSDKIYKRMDPKPPILRHVILRTASRDSEPMQGFVVGPV